MCYYTIFNFACYSFLQMKSFIRFLFMCLFLCGCNRSDEEKKSLYEYCMKIVTPDNSYEQVVLSCGCSAWSQRNDAKRRKIQTQLKEEILKCYEEPVKLSYRDRNKFVEACVSQLILSYKPSIRLSLVSQYLGGAMLSDGKGNLVSLPYIIANKEMDEKNRLWECACKRLILRDNFSLPRGIDNLILEAEKEIKVCKKLQDKYD